MSRRSSRHHKRPTRSAKIVQLRDRQQGTGTVALSTGTNGLVTSAYTSASMAASNAALSVQNQFGQHISQHPYPDMPKISDTKPLLDSLGATGTAIFGGIITSEEYNPDFYWRDAVNVYEQMLRNDGQIVAIRQQLELPLRRATWAIKPASDDPKDQEIASFVETSLFHDMQYTTSEGRTLTQKWDDILRHILMHLWFGFMAFEVNYRIEDGWVKWARWTPLLPRTIWRWWVGEDTELVGIQQWTFKDYGYRFVDIPADKLLLFVNRQEGNNFEGVSLLRAAYKHWYYKDQFYKIDAIGLERNAISVPVIRLPESDATQDSVNASNSILANLRANESMGVTLPPQWDIEYIKNNQKYSAQVMPSIQHHDTLIARSVLAQFIQLGSTETGAYALADAQIETFLEALQTVAEYVEDVINSDAIPRLVDYNFDGVAVYPRLTCSKLAAADIKDLSSAIAQLTAGQNPVIKPDDDLEDWMRSQFGLPSANRSVVNATNPTAPSDPARPDGERQSDHSDQESDPTPEQQQSKAAQGENGDAAEAAKAATAAVVSTSEARATEADDLLSEARLLREALASAQLVDAVERGLASGERDRAPEDRGRYLLFNPYHDSKGRFASGPGGNHLPTSYAQIRGMEHVAGPHGSQEGEWRHDSATGHSFYVKPALSAAHAYNEAGAMRAYAVMGAKPGVDIPHVGVVTDEQGKHYIVSQKIEGLEQHSANWWEHASTEEGPRAETEKLFGADALLAHWDTAGLAHDNLLITAGGHPVRIEAGGAMQYRAQGGLKASWKPDGAMDEPWTMRGIAHGAAHGNLQDKSVFGHMSDARTAAVLISSASRLSRNLPKLEASWEKLGMPKAQRDATLRVLRARIARVPAIVNELTGGAGGAGAKGGKSKKAHLSENDRGAFQLFNPNHVPAGNGRKSGEFDSKGGGGGGAPSGSGKGSGKAKSSAVGKSKSSGTGATAKKAPAKSGGAGSAAGGTSASAKPKTAKPKPVKGGPPVASDEALAKLPSSGTGVLHSTNAAGEAVDEHYFKGYKVATVTTHADSVEVKSYLNGNKGDTAYIKSDENLGGYRIEDAKGNPMMEGSSAFGVNSYMSGYTAKGNIFTKEAQATVKPGPAKTAKQKTAYHAEQEFKSHVPKGGNAAEYESYSTMEYHLKSGEIVTVSANTSGNGLGDFKIGRVPSGMTVDEAAQKGLVQYKFVADTNGISAALKQEGVTNKFTQTHLMHVSYAHGVAAKNAAMWAPHLSDASPTDTFGEYHINDGTHTISLSRADDGFHIRYDGPQQAPAGVKLYSGDSASGLTRSEAETYLEQHGLHDSPELKAVLDAAEEDHALASGKASKAEQARIDAVNARRAELDAKYGQYDPAKAEQYVNDIFTRSPEIEAAFNKHLEGGDGTHLTASSIAKKVHGTGLDSAEKSARGKEGLRKLNEVSEWSLLHSGAVGRDGTIRLFHGTNGTSDEAKWSSRLRSAGKRRGTPFSSSLSVARSFAEHGPHGPMIISARVPVSAVLMWHGINPQHTFAGEREYTVGKGKVSRFHFIHLK